MGATFLRSDFRLVVAVACGVIALASACEDESSHHQAVSSSATGAGGDGGAGAAAGGQAGAGGDGEIPSCTSPTVWTSEAIAEGDDVAIAVGPDDTIHVLVSDSAVVYLQRPANGAWSAPEEVLPSGDGVGPLIVDEGGRLYALAGSAFFERDENGVWTEDTTAPSLSTLYVAGDGTIHAARSAVSTTPGIYARRPSGQPWQTIDLPSGNNFGVERITVGLSGGDPVVCSTDPGTTSPSVSCSRLEGNAFTAPASAGVQGFRPQLTTSYLVSNSEAFDGGIHSTTWLNVAQADSWSELTSLTVPGIIGTIVSHEDSVQAVHAVQLLSDGDAFAIHYTHFTASGDVTWSWVECLAEQVIDVGAFADGSPVVAYRAGTSVFVAVR